MTSRWERYRVRLTYFIPIFGRLRMIRKLERLTSDVQVLSAEQDFLVQSYEARLNGIYKNLLHMSESVSFQASPVATEGEGQSASGGIDVREK